MISFIVFALCTYVFAKLCLFRYGPGRGYGRAEPEWGLRDLLRAGEPMLGIVALALCASLILWGRWYVHRASERLVAHNMNCYAEFEAATKLPRIRTRFSLTDIWDGEMSSKDAAEQEAPNLGLSRETVDRRLDERRLALERDNMRLTATGDMQGIGARFGEIGHCLHDDFDAG